MDIPKRNAWVFAYSLGSNGNNGVFDIFIFRIGYDNTVAVSKATANSKLSCTATIKNDKLHITWSNDYILTIVISA